MVEDKELQPRLEDLRALLYEWQGLIATAGWKRLEQYAKDQDTRRIAEIILNSEEHGAKVDYARGECSGIRLFSRMPGIELDRLRNEIERLAEKITEENDNEDDVDFNKQPLAP